MDKSHFYMLAVGLVIGAASLGASSDSVQSSLSTMTETVTVQYPETELRFVMSGNTQTKNVTVTGKVTDTYDGVTLSDGGYEVQLMDCSETMDFRETTKVQVKGTYKRAVGSGGTNHYLVCQEPPKMISR